MRSSLLIILVLLEYVALGQSIATRYLSSPIADAEYQTLALSKAYIEEHSFNSPWLRELDFRVRIGGDETVIDEYRMRLGLINPLEIKANKDYADLLEKSIDLESSASINDALQRRYEILLEHYFLSKKLSLIRNNVKQLEQVEGLSLDLDADIKDLISLESAKTKKLLEISGIEQKINWLNAQITNVIGETLAWETNPIINVQDLVSTLKNTESKENFMKLQVEQELALKEQLLKIDKAESFSNIGFIQSEYDISRGNSISEHLGFQVGLTIPIFNKDKPNIQRKELELIDEEVELDLTDSVSQWRTDRYFAEITRSEADLVIIEAQRSKLKKYQSLVERVNTNIQTMLELSDFEYVLDERELLIKQALRASAINLLHHQGRLYSQRENINYLDADQEAFEIK
ncbi:MAG: hypothetical protein JXR10_07730 [Cyclobacteriaceae bacterium]